MLSSQFVINLKILHQKVGDHGIFPFSLPAIRSLETLEFHPKVTYFVGENGSGKSTLLEAIAICMGFNREGGSKNFNFVSRDSSSELHSYIRLAKGYKRPKNGYFFRAESFFNVATEIENLDAEPSFGPPAIFSYGRKSLHEQSHGESFMALLDHRFSGDGVYILDEPEAALSPTRQLAALARIDQLVRARSQFIIATHSPIMLAYPDARIFHLSEAGVEPIDYEATEHYQIYKRFLNDRQSVMGKVLGI